MTDLQINRIPTSDAECTRLLSVIAQALKAMDNGEYGQARRILRTGADTAVKAVSSVLTGRYSL